MKKNKFLIEGIPAVLWGEESDRVVLAVHGNMSNKEDVPIEIFAKYATEKGYQVLSFDLPEHGDRKQEDTPCRVQNCVAEIGTIMIYIKSRWEHISLFANSMGVYFSLMALKHEKIEQAWFLSPLVDMQRMIENMMHWFSISEERLCKEQIIETPIGQTLYWDYYTYVKEHPVDRWNVPTYILYGEKDEMCEMDTVLEFAKKFATDLKVIPGAEHYFHTEEQLKALDQWVVETMK
jgi:pimeloyl-ACP methyl ester carboxylesterase